MLSICGLITFSAAIKSLSDNAPSGSKIAILQASSSATGNINNPHVVDLMLRFSGGDKRSA